MEKHKQPLVSIVIPCYNHETFVQDCIQSVIDQNYENIELIIIDDGSKDSSVEIIQKMIPACKQRFTRFEFRQRPNKGLSATLNEALEWCEGEYYSAIASDDLMLKDKTEIQVRFLEKNKEIIAVFSGIKLIDENNIVIGELLRDSQRYNFKKIIMHEHDLPAPTQMIRMNSLKNIGGYNSNILIEDWYMWIKLSELGDLFYMKKILCLYRRHNSNISSNLLIMQQGRLQVLDEFKSSKYYNRACKKIEWVNFIESISVSKHMKFFKYIKIFFYNPVRAIRFYFKQV